MMVIRRFFPAFFCVFLLAACTQGFGTHGSSGTAADATTAYPPDRSAWTSAPAAAQAAHARALQAALERFESTPETWSAGGYSGVLTVLGTGDVRDTKCRSFTDRITGGGESTEVRDVACWGDGWEMTRDGAVSAVVAPAFAEVNRVYVIKRGGSLQDVAKVTGASLADLESLNPAYPERLVAGTRILLP